MSAEDYFSKTYQSGRAKFLAACRELRLQPTEFRTPEGAQPPDPPLADCLRLGSPSANHLLVACGGDRKADALCTAAIETGWLRRFGKASLSADSAIALVHHGAAPQTGGELPEAFAPPPEWEDDILARVEKRYAEYARQHGIDSAGAPLAEPSDADVPGYPTRVMDMLAHKVAPSAVDRIVLLEFRVGTGPWGEAELTPCHPAESGSARLARKWFGLPEPVSDTPRAEAELGSLGAGLRRRFFQVDVVAATVSFGTYSMKSVLESLAARPDGRAAPETGAMLYLRDPAWQQAVWNNAVVVIQRALTGMRSR